jgi:hypothetical protein
VAVSRNNLAKTIGLCAAGLMIVVGLILYSVKGPAASRQSPRTAEPPTVQDAGALAPVTSESGAAREVDPPTEPAAGQSVSAPSRVVEAAPPARTPPRPVAQGGLPPLPPLGHGPDAGNVEPGGPPPDVLWLAGVIEGEPTVALLRRGENRYLVGEGDTIEDGYQVVKIATGSVTLRHGGRKRTLRVGQY